MLIPAHQDNLSGAFWRLQGLLKPLLKTEYHSNPHISLPGRRLLLLCAVMVSEGISRSSRSPWVTLSSPFPTVPQNVRQCHPAALPTGQQHSSGP